MAKTQVREILRSNDTKKEKFDYLWEYYKWHVFSIIAAIFIVIYIIFQMLNQPQVAYNIGILGPETTAEENEMMSSDLKKLLGIEEDQGEVFVTVTAEGQMAERFFAQLTASEYDLIMMTENGFNQFAADQGMQDYAFEGIDEEDLYYADGSQEIVGISSNALPFFEPYPFIENMVVMVPENSSQGEETMRFFEEQGILVKE